MSLGFVLREAIASVAIEHPEDCDCIVCRANDGDIDAFAEIAIDVQARLTDGQIRAARGVNP